MYVAHPFLRHPADEARLWRYLTPTAFLSLLLSRSLYFAPLASFEDPFEGVPPRAVFDALRQSGIPPSAARDRLATWHRMIRLCRNTVCANCWHADDDESEAMWKLYGIFDDGLAIVSTFGSIRAACAQVDVTGGLVDYSGDEFAAGTAEADLLRWATTKRPSYKYENEFRLLVRCAVRHDGDARCDGVALPVDPAVLIEEVVLSPRMQRWQADLFMALIDRLDFRRPVRASALLLAP